MLYLIDVMSEFFFRLARSLTIWQIEAFYKKLDNEKVLYLIWFYFYQTILLFSFIYDF